MPIVVRCANPACDKVHAFKDRYAGMRGRCPACSNWLALPRRVMPQPTPPAVSPTPRRQRSGTGSLVLLTMAALSLGLVAAVPFVEQPALHLSGDLVQSPLTGQQLGVRPEAAGVFTIVPLSVAGMVLLSVVIGFARRRFDFLALTPAYLTLFAAWGMVVLAAFIFRDHLTLLTLFEERAKAILAVDGSRVGELSITWGQSLFVGLIGAIGGFILPVAALAGTHRTIRGRILFGSLVCAMLFIGAAILFAAELGLGQVQIAL
jgi:hypothetical protein